MLARVRSALSIPLGPGVCDTAASPCARPGSTGTARGVVVKDGVPAVGLPVSPVSGTK